MAYIFTIIIAFALYIVTMWTDSNLEYLLSMFKGYEVEIPFWISFLITLLLNGAIIVFNVIIELIKLVL